MARTKRFITMPDRPLTRRQEDRFKKHFKDLERWVELQGADDYASGPLEDGHFMGDVRSRRIEFVDKDVIYDVVLTCRRGI